MKKCEVIDLKQIVLNFETDKPKIRYHALEVLNYIERWEANVIDINRVNNIPVGDLAVLEGGKE
jgi:hypothetical protein